MPPDLTHRANLEEQMDSLPSYQEYRTCLHDLDSVSRTVLAHRPTLHFLDQLLAREPTHIPRLLRILDVACGDGAMLRRIARWAARQNLPVQLTGLDLNPRAIEVAHEFPITHPPIRYIIGDVFDSTGTYDIILSAHFTHHLSDPQLLRFLHWMERHATLGWFINDLHRHPNPYRLFRLLTAVAPWHPLIASDGLISIRRAFTLEDWRTLLTTAQIPQAIPQEQFPARITVTRLK